MIGKSTTRREFLRHAAAGAALPQALAGIGGLASLSTQAAGTDYKALVCLYMGGGNDSHNWLVPIDGSYADYARGRSNLAAPLSALTPLSQAPDQAAGRRFGMPEALSPLRTLYEQGALAFVANVGPLERPTTKRDFQNSNRLPSKLFSHNDQASNWQSFGPEGTTVGWGGRIADVLLATNDNPVFTSVSAAGNAVFLSGRAASQYQLGATGAIGVNAWRSGSTLGSTTMADALKRIHGMTAPDTVQSLYASTVRRSVEAHDTLARALATAPVPALPRLSITTPGGDTIALEQLPLAAQLRSVAQLIAASRTLGMRRQVFMVAMGGFDTHGSQLRDEPRLMASVAHAAQYFHAEMQRMGLADSVTLFTASDFGRTLTSNGAGSDHGWGSHHFVMGGAVRGRNIYGKFPDLASGSADDIGSGRLLPSTSVSEYSAALARWMGVSNSDLPLIFPALPEFGNPPLAMLG